MPPALIDSVSVLEKTADVFPSNRTKGYCSEKSPQRAVARPFKLLPPRTVYQTGRMHAWPTIERYTAEKISSIQEKRSRKRFHSNPDLETDRQSAAKLVLSYEYATKTTPPTRWAPTEPRSQQAGRAEAIAVCVVINHPPIVLFSS